MVSSPTRPIAVGSINVLLTSSDDHHLSFIIQIYEHKHSHKNAQSIDSVLSLKIKISVEYGRWDVKVYVYMVVELCEYESARR